MKSEQLKQKNKTITNLDTKVRKALGDNESLKFYFENKMRNVEIKNKNLHSENEKLSANLKLEQNKLKEILFAKKITKDAFIQTNSINVHAKETQTKNDIEIVGKSKQDIHIQTENLKVNNTSTQTTFIDLNKDTNEPSNAKKLTTKIDASTSTESATIKKNAPKNINKSKWAWSPKNYKIHSSKIPIENDYSTNSKTFANAASNITKPCIDENGVFTSSGSYSYEKPLWSRW